MSEAGGFVDVFKESGIIAGPTRWATRTGPMIAAALGDCDADGLPDAFVFNWAEEGRLWRNKGQFQFETAPSGIVGRVATDSDVPGPTSAAFGDLDNDGRPDLLLGFMTSHPFTGSGGDDEMRVFRNEGDCQFTEVTKQWGFDRFAHDEVAILAGFDLSDVNLDGRLDVLVRKIMNKNARASLFMSQPDGTWIDQGLELFTQTSGACWSNLFTDIDSDGFTDLFMFCDHYLGSVGRFYRRDPTSTVPRYEEQIFDPRFFGDDATTGALMGGAVGDVDGDGLLDIFITDIGAQHLYTHVSGMKDVATQHGVAMPRLADGSDSVGWSVSFADYDNDTWPDLTVSRGTTDGWLIPQRMVLMRNRADGTFENTTPLFRQAGPHDHTWATASDLDRDGRIDYWFGGQHERPLILKNQVVGGASVAVKLRGRTSNAEGVGARVTAKVGGRTLVQEMFAGSGPWGYGEHRLHFGLGTAAQADSVEVRWPSGFVQTVGPTAAGAELVVEEPELIQLDRTVLHSGETVTVTVKPAKPDGTSLGSGHEVTLRVEPGDQTITASDQGNGAYAAAFTPDAKGFFVFTVRINGQALLAHPQVLVQ